MTAAPPETAGPTFTEPNEAEVRWMEGHLQFIAAQQVDLNDSSQIGEFYERVLNSWLSDPEESRTDPSDFINLLGTAFGECLVRQTSLRWVVASDELATELAVHDDRSDLLVYPANAVAKRWTERQSGDFIPGMTQDIVMRLSQNQYAPPDHA
ncbi:DUF3806 domain-containing protein [Pseudarthrobacter sp. DSP2-3-2b1]|uniref:DUF3806 domain-containing protein n=1 Tax=Pseudarthrobacter sp. DSP2-3-2b1 TaxID=2804661 RepID=UPI003CF1A458